MFHHQQQNVYMQIGCGINQVKLNLFILNTLTWRREERTVDHYQLQNVCADRMWHQINTDKAREKNGGGIQGFLPAAARWHHR
jgi:hypothetical protein